MGVVGTKLRSWSLKLLEKGGRWGVPWGGGRDRIILLFVHRREGACGREIAVERAKVSRFRFALGLIVSAGFLL